MMRVTRRCARKPHRCGYSGRMIQRGEVYLEHVISPNHDDVGNATWWRVAECWDCAHRYGRAELVEDFA